MKDKRVYVTRDSYTMYVDVWPATVGIRKFHGCVQYGAAWSNYWRTSALIRGGMKGAEILTKEDCRKRYGFYPPPGTAWYINARGKRTKVELDFSP